MRKLESLDSLLEPETCTVRGCRAAMYQETEKAISRKKEMKAKWSEMKNHMACERDRHMHTDCLVFAIFSPCLLPFLRPDYSAFFLGSMEYTSFSYQ